MKNNNIRLSTHHYESFEIIEENYFENLKNTQNKIPKQYPEFLKTLIEKTENNPPAMPDDFFIQTLIYLYSSAENNEITEPELSGEIQMTLSEIYVEYIDIVKNLDLPTVEKEKPKNKFLILKNYFKPYEY